MRRHTLVALGITEDSLPGIDEAEQLSLHPLKSRLECRVDRLAPRRVALQLLLQRLNTLG